MLMTNAGATGAAQVAVERELRSRSTARSAASATRSQLSHLNALAGRTVSFSPLMLEALELACVPPPS